MEYKADKSYAEIWKFIGIIVVIIFLIFLCFFDYSRQSHLQVKAMSVNHLKDVNGQSSNIIRARLDNALSQVEYTASLFSSSAIPSGSRKSMLNQLKESCQFNQIWYIDNKRTFYTPDEKKQNTGGEAFIGPLFHGKPGISDVFQPTGSQEDVLLFYAPIKKNSVVVAGIAGSLNIADVVDLVTNTGFTGRAYSYIIQPDGQIVMQTKHEESLYYGHDLFEFFGGDTDKTSISAEKLKKNMENQKSGVISYSKGKSNRVGCYAPLGINDWYVYTIISTDVIEENMAPISRTALLLTFKLVLIFIGLTILIVLWHRKTQKTILKAKQQAERSNRKFELAICHTPILIAEYEPKEDILQLTGSSETEFAQLPSAIPHVSSQSVKSGLVTEASVADLHQLLKDVLAGKSNISADLEGGSAFTSSTWYRLTLSPVLDDHGKVSMAIGTLEDVTTRKKIEHKYIQQEQFRSAILSDAISTWSLNLTTCKFLSYVYRGEDHFHQVKNKEYDEDTVQMLCSCVHPDDKEKLLRLLDTDTLITFYEFGLHEMKEEFRAKKKEAPDYSWYSAKLNFLQDTSTKDPLVFCYTRNIDKQKKRELSLQFESERDPLTGLYNRSTIESIITAQLSEDSGSAHIEGFFMLDLDQFKRINDRHGHLIGDLLLKEVARILESLMAPQDYAARLGGDEFCCFIRSQLSTDAILAMAEQICTAIDSIRLDEAPECKTSSSIGVAFAYRHGNTFEELYDHADQALYNAKNAGKNCIKVFDPAQN